MIFLTIERGLVVRGIPWVVCDQKITKVDPGLGMFTQVSPGPESEWRSHLTSTSILLICSSITLQTTLTGHVNIRVQGNVYY